jgi:hypothetical protein
MDIIGGIAAATEGLKLVNELRKIDQELDKAELKIRLVDVVDKLVDAKQALVDAQEREASLRNEIVALKDRAALRAALKDTNGLLFEINEAGENVGEPYCNLCFVKEDKQIRMRHFEAKAGIHSHYKCDNCKTYVITGPTLPMPTRNGDRNSWIR